MQNKIYTYIGPILVAINPYQWLDLYSDITMRSYKNMQLEQVKPHVYAIADTAYNDMLLKNRNQVV